MVSPRLEVTIKLCGSREDYRRHGEDVRIHLDPGKYDFFNSMTLKHHMRKTHIHCAGSLGRVTTSMKVIEEIGNHRKIK